MTACVPSLITRLAASLTLPILLGACADNRAEEPVPYDASDAVAFVGVNVISMAGAEEVLEGYTVVVADGRIRAVGPADQVDVPDGAERVDGSGRYLIPGLAEMHGHIPGGNNRPYAENVLFLYVSNGVTTVRGMAGNPLHLELREETESGALIGPMIRAASPGLSGDDTRTPEDVERAVRDRHAAGYDLIKIGGMPTESYEHMAHVAHEIGIPFGGHIPEAVGLVGALDARQISIDHLDRYVEFMAPGYREMPDRQAGFFGSGIVDLVDTGLLPEAIERTIEAGTWNVPTLSLVEHLASPEPPEEMIQWPEMRYMPRNVLDGWVRSKHDYGARADFQPEAANALVDLRRRITRELHDAGALIALGSDAPQFFNVPGFSIHHEMEMMVASGLTPWEVLVTGTRNPAIYFGTPDEFGTVEVGRRADLILLTANPLDDIANVRRRAGVMVRGAWLPESEIRRRLDEIAAEVARNE